jgi:hypothetical protein
VEGLADILVAGPGRLVRTWSRGQHPWIGQVQPAGGAEQKMSVKGQETYLWDTYNGQETNLWASYGDFPPEAVAQASEGQVSLAWKTSLEVRESFG